MLWYHTDGISLQRNFAKPLPLVTSSPQRPPDPCRSKALASRNMQTGRGPAACTFRETRGGQGSKRHGRWTFSCSFYSIYLSVSLYLSVSSTRTQHPPHFVIYQATHSQDERSFRGLWKTGPQSGGIAYRYRGAPGPVQRCGGLLEPSDPSDPTSETPSDLSDPRFFSGSTLKWWCPILEETGLRATRRSRQLGIHRHRFTAVRSSADSIHYRKYPSETARKLRRCWPKRPFAIEDAKQHQVNLEGQ